MSGREERRASPNPRPCVVFTAPLPGGPEALLEDFARVVILRPRGVPSEKEIADRLAPADGAVTLLSDPVTARVLQACPRLRVVANYAVGYDNVDLAAAAERGIVVTNTPDVLTEATADTTWALILAAARRVAEGDRMVRAGKFRGWGPDLLLGIDLRGKLLGIVGMGRIGRAVARRAPAFGMRVAYCDTERMPDSAEAALCARFLRLEELLRRSDVITLHCPLNATTHHLLDPAHLATLKPTAVLVNTARGPVVDEAALVESLRSGRLAAAGLDVYEREPALSPGLAELPNVLLLPHLGSAGRETREAMARLAAENVREVLSGRPALTPVPMPNRAGLTRDHARIQES